ncbi:hypothetical protein HJC03_06875 [Rhizobium sp. NLR4b]|uniref:hypothetical protein n=1 Tax=unclassified Rhizobium TaxID=2613769 RepID=UPI001C8288E2|nr:MULTISPECIES: hypothetical protein [unclassified Rhizobium]MBX5250126.1 hypothetical protein [Rhizobium sp. NLR4b]MBX5282706.1 hypothetical protein [Rhizobium sp. NLR10a]
MSNEIIIACLPFLWPSASARTVGREFQAFMHLPAMRLRRKGATVERESPPTGLSLISCPLSHSIGILRGQNRNPHLHHLPVS